MESSDDHLLSPEPEENIIVKAEHIHKEHYYRVRSRENLCKVKITNEEGQIYYIELTPETDFWKENNKYFQDDLNKFSKLINDTLVLETGDITFKIIKEDLDELILKLNYQGLFGFECFLAIPRKKDRVDLLDGEIQDLQRLNEEKDKKIIDLETRLKWVEDIIHMNLELRKFHNGPFLDFPNKGYSRQWPPLKYSIPGTGWMHGTPDKFDYCKGFNDKYTTEHDFVNQVITPCSRWGPTCFEEFNEYLKIYKDADFNSKLKHPQQYKHLHEKIPWASVPKHPSNPTIKEFTDLPKWLEFLDKWKDKK